VSDKGVPLTWAWYDDSACPQCPSSRSTDRSISSQSKNRTPFHAPETCSSAKHMLQSTLQYTSTLVYCWSQGLTSNSTQKMSHQRRSPSQSLTHNSTQQNQVIQQQEHSKLTGKSHTECWTSTNSQLYKRWKLNLTNNVTEELLAPVCVCVSLCTTVVHNTARSSSENLPSNLQTNIIAQMWFVGWQKCTPQQSKLHHTLVYSLKCTLHFNTPQNTPE